MCDDVDFYNVLMIITFIEKVSDLQTQVHWQSVNFEIINIQINDLVFSKDKLNMVFKKSKISTIR